jgi:hypothetical protein
MNYYLAVTDKHTLNFRVKTLTIGMGIEKYEWSMDEVGWSTDGVPVEYGWSRVEYQWSTSEVPME